MNNIKNSIMKYIVQLIAFISSCCQNQIYNDGEFYRCCECEKIQNHIP